MRVRISVEALSGGHWWVVRCDTDQGQSGVVATARKVAIACDEAHEFAKRLVGHEVSFVFPKRLEDKEPSLDPPRWAVNEHTALRPDREAIRQRVGIAEKHAQQYERLERHRLGVISAEDVEAWEIAEEFEDFALANRSLVFEDTPEHDIADRAAEGTQWNAARSNAWARDGSRTDFFRPEPRIFSVPLKIWTASAISEDRSIRQRLMGTKRGAPKNPLFAAYLAERYARSVGGLVKPHASAEQAEKVRDALVSGASIRAAARIAGVGKGIAQRIYTTVFASAETKPMCACGQVATHRGWCSVRYANSPKRQAVMKRLTAPATRPPRPPRPPQP